MTRNCTNYKKAIGDIATILAFMSHELAMIKIKGGNSQQFLSSLPSEHPPDTPLHREEEETHCPLVH